MPGNGGVGITIHSITLAGKYLGSFHENHPVKYKKHKRFIPAHSR